MYRFWLTRVLLALAIAGMPLQGMAETLSAIFCLPHVHAHGDQIEHDHGLADHEHTGSHDPGPQQSDKSDAGGTQASMDHVCCPIVVSGLPPSTSFKGIP